MRFLALLASLSVALSSTCASAQDRWLPVREISLEVKAGSPLDFSRLLKNPPIGRESGIVINSEGRLARADALSKPVRFLCASLGWSPASGGFPDHADADRYAEQLRMHGYNVARFHFLDASLMFGRSADFDFDPEVLDRFRYLMAALKRNGIYWILDGMSSPRGGLGGYEDRWDPVGGVKLAVYTDETAFEHWLRLQKMILASVNPYTGVAPIRDPALMLMVPVNENGLDFDTVVQEGRTGVPYPEALKPAFNAWLKERFGTTAALSARWGWIDPAESVEQGTIALPQNRYERSPRIRDMQAFLIDMETRLAKRMDKALRDLGYRGIVSPYNNWPSLQTGLTRRAQQAVAMNTYQDWVGSYEPGTSIQGTSSLEDGANYLRLIAGARWLGKPFVVTEYDHLFWSPYRYEAGIVMPSYAALQNWDLICRHAHGPIILAYGENVAHKRQMLPYAIALDPVARAGETLAALLFRRGDVQGAPISVPFLIDPEAGPGDSTQAREPEELTRLALVAAIGMKDATKVDSGDIAVAVDRQQSSLAQVVTSLLDTGTLSAEAGADIAQGIALSVTGELRLDPAKKQMTVQTDKTQAIAYAALSESVRLSDLTIEKASGKGLFAVSSLDGKPIRDSRRLLVIFATDAHNSDMRFSDADEKVIADFGHLPVLIKGGDVSFSLSGKGRWRLSPVGLDGQVHDAVAKGEGAVETTLSNDLPQGPTTYFLIER